MKALSLLQPYASLIALGLKEFETRSWYTPYRGPLAIHASKRWTREEIAITDYLGRYFDQVFSKLSYPMPLGAVLCICNLLDCYRTPMSGLSTLEYAAGNFASGRYAWKLELVKIFPAPISARGALGLWDWEWSEN
jgi:activating signal cointegrator 1